MKFWIKNFPLTIVSQQFLDGRRTEKVPDLVQLSGYGYMQEVAKHERNARVALDDS